MNYPAQIEASVADLRRAIEAYKEHYGYNPEGDLFAALKVCEDYVNSQNDVDSTDLAREAFTLAKDLLAYDQQPETSPPHAPNSQLIRATLLMLHALQEPSLEDCAHNCRLAASQAYRIFVEINAAQRRAAELGVK